MKTIIAQGAEAILYVSEHDGQKVLVKERVKKGYRIKEIDSKLRKTRTKGEAKLLREARKIGVATPQILELTDDKIVMEWVDGERLKELLNSADDSTMESVCIKIGKSIGKLHGADIVHGDLTTSNMIFSAGKVYFIDFGLGIFSKRIEDKGMDLKLLRQAVESTHWKILKPCWNNILKGYKQEYRDAEKVIEKIKQIDKRGRYVDR